MRKTCVIGLALWISAMGIGVRGQNLNTAEWIARLQEYEEDYKSTKADIVALQQRQESMDRRMAEELARIRQEIAGLREGIAKAGAGAVGRDQLERVVEQVREVDRKRQEDTKFLSKQIEELAKLPAPPPPAASADRGRVGSGGGRRGGGTVSKPDVDDGVMKGSDGVKTGSGGSGAGGGGGKAGGEEWAGDYYEHTVQQGDSLARILAAYNKEHGLKVRLADLEKANPGLNAKRLIPGKKLRVPAIK